MAFTIDRRTPLDPDAAWVALTDLAAHGRFVPFTEVEVRGDGLALGVEVVAVTRLGPIAGADRMLVTALETGRRLRIVKTGRFLRGWTEIAVDPATDGTAVRWTEELWLPGLHRLTRPLGDRLGPRLFGPLVDGLLAGAGRPDPRGRR